MRIRSLALAVGTIACLTLTAVVAPMVAQQAAAPAAPAAPAANPLDTIPEKLPFNVAYGPPISAQRAQAVIQASAADATKRGWPMNIAVVDSGANLVAFLRMDGAMLASIPIAQHKARVSARFRRPTKVFEDAIQKSDYKYILTLDEIGRAHVLT